MPTHWQRIKGYDYWEKRKPGQGGTFLEGCDLLMEESTTIVPVPILMEESVGSDTPAHQEECP